MAMAMASPAAAAVTTSRNFKPSASRSSPCNSRSGSAGVSHLRTSFVGMSLGTRSGQQNCLRHGEASPLQELAFAHPRRSPAHAAPAKLVSTTVAKLKTHKASAKRFRVTGSGKIMRRQAFKQHLLSKKSTRRKRRLSKSLRVSRTDYDNVTRALPYLKVKGRLA